MSKQEIKDLFITELMNTSLYNEVLNMKQKIINEIITPKVQKYVVYEFSWVLSDEEKDIIKMCMLVEFGFTTDNLNNQSIMIDMEKFL